jgi:hypothetical protein
MRYFCKFPDYLKDHLQYKKKITFKDMFDEFSQGFYEKFYSLFLCEAAHGVFLQEILRVNRSRRKQEYIMVDTNFSNYASNLLSVLFSSLLYGFFNKYDDFFPNNLLANNSEIFNKVKEIKVWMKEFIEIHEKKILGSNNWIKLLKPIIY